jgi:hypothetical protein
MKLFVYFIFVLFILSLNLQAQSTTTAGGGDIPCQFFPSNNAWNTAIDKLPVDANSSKYINIIGPTIGLHPDFGAGLYDGSPMGIPYVMVNGSQPKVNIVFDTYSESDPGPYPIPPSPPIEGGDASSGDRHVLVVDTTNLILYETYSTYPNNDGTWHAGSGAIFDLKSNTLRPDTWTSADAAGLPILPGLVRYDEVAKGEINHAIRFTVPKTQKKYVWPARHYASSITDTQYPPMGQRFRLKSSFDISTYSAVNQVILTAMKKYGIILADNGSAIYISGCPDSRWNNDDLSNLKKIKGASFEAVDCSSLMIDPNSGEAKQPNGTKPNVPYIQPPYPVFCSGDSVILYITPQTSVNYQWKNGTQNVGANSASYTATTSGTYTVVVTNNFGSATSNIAIVSELYKPSSATIIADGQTEFCEGGHISLFIPYQEGVTYQWRNNNLNVGTNSNTIVVSESGVYTVELSNYCGTTLINNSITITVYPRPTTPSISQIGDDTLACSVDADSYDWSLDDTLTNFTTKIIKVVKSGKYNVGVVQNGCASNWSAPYQFTSTGVKELDKKGTTSVFPNPALDFITISGYAGTAIIYDIIGKEVWRGNFGAKENINISKLQTGLYYIKINNHNQFNFIKFFKQ